MRSFSILMCLMCFGCGEPVARPLDGGPSDTSLHPTDVAVEPGWVGTRCAAETLAPCGPASPPCCEGLTCVRDVCLRVLGQVCQFPWQCASDACLLRADEPGASRCAPPRDMP